MLFLQDYLNSGKTLDELKTEFAINCYEHPNGLPLVGFKYNQIDSPKTHPIVRECRGLVLEKNTWQLVAKPFSRFFNAGEVLEEYKNFNWSNFTCSSKEDGSLIILYFYNNEWHANTSGSFGYQFVNFSDKTWRELFWETVRLDKTKLDTKLTYIFELCTTLNRVVRDYRLPTAFLLSAIETSTCKEVSEFEADKLAETLSVFRPTRFQFKSLAEISNFLNQIQREDRTFEGVVIRDDQNLRFKIKTETYVNLHQLSDNGNIADPKRLVPIILNGEADEVSIALPHLKDLILTVSKDIESEWLQLAEVWEKHHSIADQKQFALTIKDKTSYTGLLFTLRKLKGQHQTLQDLKHLWRENSDGIIKRLYKN